MSLFAATKCVPFCGNVDTPFVQRFSANFTKHNTRILEQACFFVCEEIDSTDGNSNAGLSEALGDQNIHTLQNQVEYIISKYIETEFMNIQFR